MNRFSSFIGILFGVIIILMNMIDFEKGKILSTFFNLNAMLVVVGGTFSAAFINYSFSEMSQFFKGFGKVFLPEKFSKSEVIEEIIYLSKVSNRSGILELEKHIDLQNDKFIKFSLSEILVYKKTAELERSLNNHLNAMKLRHLNAQDIFNNMATYAPAFGMMGTVMGLIIMMTSQFSGDSGNSENMLSALLSGMGLALVTTFYGVLIANFIFTPMAGKLAGLSSKEAKKNEIIIQGILAIKEGMPTSFLKEYLSSNLSYKEKLENESFIL